MIPCIICNRVFPNHDVGVELLISTGVCLNCYGRGTRAPVSRWCFGKTSEYDPESVECSGLCPDKKICKMVVEGEIIWK